jgi:hypothetical protein
VRIGRPRPQTGWEAHLKIDDQRSWPFAAVFAAGLLGAAALLAAPARADDKPPSTGDETACKILKITQSGTDPESGVHVVIRFDWPTAPGLAKQAIYMELYLAKRKSECGGRVPMTNANVSEGISGQRSIDGYPCKLKATWQRI